MSRGVTSRPAFDRLSRSDRAHFPSDLEVPDLERSGIARSFRAAYTIVYGHPPGGRDYHRIERNLAGAYEHRGNRLHVKRNDFLWRGDEPMPVPTRDGIFDAVPSRMSWRQRSVLGQIWSLAGRARGLTDEQLAKELRPFRRETFRVFDPETGKVIRLPLETDPTRFRAFAMSPEARQERVISPRLSPSSPGATT